MKLILFLGIVLLIGCTTKKREISKLLKNTDRIKLLNISNGDTFFYDIKDEIGIGIFTEIITCKKEDLPIGHKYGEILYYFDDTIILKADVYKASITYNFNNVQYKNRITYRAGMYFSEVKYQN